MNILLVCISFIRNTLTPASIDEGIPQSLDLWDDFRRQSTRRSIHKNVIPCRTRNVKCHPTLSLSWKLIVNENRLLLNHLIDFSRACALLNPQFLFGRPNIDGCLAFQCDPGLAATVLYDLIYSPPVKPIVLGGCSLVCQSVAETAKLYNLVVVGYGSSSPSLSDRKRFPTFFRTHPSATIHNPTRIKLFKKFQWSRISIILEAEEVFVSVNQY